jgi:hypothetical protein
MNETLIAEQRREAGDHRAKWHVGRIACVVIAVMLTSGGLGGLAQRRPVLDRH